MKYFETTLEVKASDLDQLQHVNNVRYVQWVQDIAESHWLEKASDVLLNNYFWVLVSHHIDYKQAAFLGDTILLKTYVIKSEGVTSIRQVDILNALTEEILATSTTKWCFMSKQTKRPARIPKEIRTLFD